MSSTISDEAQACPRIVRGAACNRHLILVCAQAGSSCTKCGHRHRSLRSAKNARYTCVFDDTLDGISGLTSPAFPNPSSCWFGGGTHVVYTYVDTGQTRRVEHRVRLFLRRRHYQGAAAGGGGGGLHALGPRGKQRYAAGGLRKKGTRRMGLSCTLAGFCAEYAHMQSLSAVGVESFFFRAA